MGKSLFLKKNDWVGLHRPEEGTIPFKYKIWLGLTIQGMGPSHLTLIGPGEVQVYLTDFDLKLQENFLSTSYVFFIPNSAETFSGSF